MGQALTRWAGGHGVWLGWMRMAPREGDGGHSRSVCPQVPKPGRPRHPGPHSPGFEGGSWSPTGQRLFHAGPEEALEEAKPWARAPPPLSRCFTGLEEDRDHVYHPRSPDPRPPAGEIKPAEGAACPQEQHRAPAVWERRAAGCPTHAGSPLCKLSFSPARRLLAWHFSCSLASQVLDKGDGAALKREDWGGGDPALLAQGPARAQWGRRA